MADQSVCRIENRVGSGGRSRLSSNIAKADYAEIVSACISWKAGIQESRLMSNDLQRSAQKVSSHIGFRVASGPARLCPMG